MGQAVCCSRQPNKGGNRFSVNPSAPEKVAPTREDPEVTNSFIDPQEVENASYLSGLDNLGNSCYMSAALQCVIHTPELLQYFMTGRFRTDLSLNDSKPTKQSKKVLNELIKLIGRVRTEKIVKPSQFKLAVNEANSMVGLCD